MTKHQRKNHRIPGHTPEQEFADELGLTKETLRKYRRQGKGAAYIVVGRQVHYVDEDKVRWLRSLRVMPARSSGQAA